LQNTWIPAFAGIPLCLFKRLSRFSIKEKFVAAGKVSALMRYAILANPSSGGIPAERKRLLLRDAAIILDAKVHGLDVRTPEEFKECAIRAARECDILVGAGGDGTLSMLVNAIDRGTTPVGFIPLGTGNAMRHALRLKGNIEAISRKIRDAPVRHFDLVECRGMVGFSASIGIESGVLRMRKRYQKLNKIGFCAYLFAVLAAYPGKHKRVSGTLEVDGVESKLQQVLTLLVVKHPYHGFRMKVVPEAKLDDGKLHILTVNSGFWKSLFWGTASFVSSNRIGHYQTGMRVKAMLDRPHFLQADGEEWWEAQEFRFKVLQRAIMMKE